MKLILLFLFLTSTSWAHQYLETVTHADLYRKAVELNSIASARDVLIVFDIDNTLLKAKQPLGSDQWFEWQADAIKANSSEAIFGTFEELLNTQADFFQLSSMSLTEPELPQMVTTLKRMGNSIVLLTSRGPNLRNVTERELLRNNLWFGDKTIGQGFPYEFMEAPFKNKVSFMNGIFMTSGHHKGEALSYLIKKSRRNFKAVIFIDDHERHTKRVYETFSNSHTPEIVTLRYGKEDEAVRAFKMSSKASVNSATLELIRTNRKIFK